MEREHPRDEVEREQEALERSNPEGLIGDTADNRNLSGSTTWETLPDQQDQPDEESDGGSDDEEGSEADR